MMNHIDLMGRIVKDIELRKTGSGVSVASFTIACDRDFGQNGEKETDFIEIVAWKHNADFVANHFSKGRMIAVSGRLQNRKWTDKDGNKRTAAEVVASNCYFADSKKETSDNNFTAGNFAMLDGDDDALPF